MCFSSVDVYTWEVVDSTFFYCYFYPSYVLLFSTCDTLAVAIV